jgi:hypothetical protein
MDTTRTYRDQDNDVNTPEGEQPDWVASSENEPPFHIPRD